MKNVIQLTEGIYVTASYSLFKMEKLTLISVSFPTRLGFTYTRRYYHKAASICPHKTKQ